MMPVIAHGEGPCALKSFAVTPEAGRLAAWRDGRTLALADGRELVLAGIEVPRPHHALDRTGGAAGNAGLRPIDTPIHFVHAAPGQPDRYGRWPAWVWIEGDDRALQYRLVDGGEALASGIPVEGEGAKTCHTSLFGAEKAARTTGQGFWKDAVAIKNAESPGEIAPLVGQFQIIEGRVRAVRETRGTVYVNFGRRWLTGFAAYIPKRALRAIEAGRQRPASWEKKRIRVRGWIEAGSGPRMLLTQPEQIETAAEDGNLAAAP